MLLHVVENSWSYGPTPLVFSTADVSSSSPHILNSEQFLIFICVSVWNLQVYSKVCVTNSQFVNCRYFISVLNSAKSLKKILLENAIGSMKKNKLGINI